MGFFDWLSGKATGERPTRPDAAPRDDQIIITLVPKTFDPGSEEGDVRWFGCVPQNQHGERYSYDDNRLHKLGLYIFQVAGVQRRKRELQNVSFQPPSFVSLVCEDENPYDKNAVAVWSLDRSIMVGYVPKELAPEIRRTMVDHPQSRGITIAHCLKKKTRVALTVMFGPLNGL